MQCPRCRHENREGRRFCAECGAALAQVCPSCGFANSNAQQIIERATATVILRADRVIE